MQIINRTISLKQILASLLIAELLLLILGAFNALILIVPFIPLIIYAFNLKVIEKTVTLKRLLKYIVVAVVFLVISVFILLFLEPHNFVRWRRMIGVVSALYFIIVIVKGSFFTETQELDYNNANNLLLLKQINILYLLFFGLISIIIYNDFLGVKTSSSSILLNTRFLIGGVLLVSILMKIVFMSKMKDYSTSANVVKALSQKKIEEYMSLLQNQFEQKQLYLRHDLNREVIARETKIPIEDLDYLFNHYIELDINYFIAQYRINHALNLMHEKGDVFTLNAISSESGFRSRVTFNKYFKYFTKVLPSEYLYKSKRFIS